jgi:DNA repair exonuclease SbcCD nuclease subunit
MFSIGADFHLKKSNLLSHSKVLDEMIEKAKGDYLIIAGDLFDKEEDFDTDLQKILTLKNAVRRFKEVHIIKGTDSHDFTYRKKHIKMAQLLGNNVFFYEKATSTIINGKKVLFLPEEYPLNREKYYKPFFNEKYDLIVGHGNIFNAKTTTGFIVTPNEFKNKGFYAEDLGNLAKFVVFGHIHNHQLLTNNVMYAGSLTTNTFADTDEKGFIEINLDDNKYEFIPVKKNKKFLTYSNNELNETLIEEIKKEIDNGNKVRIIVENNDECNIPLELKDMVKIVKKEKNDLEELKNLTLNYNFNKLLNNPKEIYLELIENEKISQKKKSSLKKEIERVFA